MRSVENRRVAAIDRFLPEWDAHEVHAVVLETPPGRALAAALAAPAAPDAIVGALFRLRGLPASGSIESLLRGIGFAPLAEEPGEVVFGAAGTPWQPRTGLSPFGEAAPGSVQVAANFRVEWLADGLSRLSTETRIRAVDDDARRRFRRYWRVTGPFSGLIRRRWLAGIRRALGA